MKEKLLFIGFLILLISSTANAQQVYKPSASAKDDQKGKIQFDPNKPPPTPATIPTGTYLLYNGNTNKGMNILGGKDMNNANLGLWDLSNQDNEQFTIEPSNEADYYYIRTKWGRAINIAGGTNAPGSNVITWDFVSTDNEKWRFFKVGTGYSIQSKLGTYLNYNGSPNPVSGNQLVMSNTSAYWRLEKAQVFDGGTLKITLCGIASCEDNPNGRNHGVDVYGKIKGTYNSGGSQQYQYMFLDIPQNNQSNGYIKTTTWFDYKAKLLSGQEVLTNVSNWVDIGFRLNTIEVQGPLENVVIHLFKTYDLFRQMGLGDRRYKLTSDDLSVVLKQDLWIDQNPKLAATKYFVATLRPGDDTYLNVQYKLEWSPIFK
jgi:hypothetical protein